MGKLARHAQPLPLLDGTARGVVEHNLKAILRVGDDGKASQPLPDLIAYPPKISVMVAYWRSPANILDADTASMAIDGADMQIVRIGPKLPAIGGGGIV